MKYKLHLLLLFLLTVCTSLIYGQTLIIKTGINSSTLKSKPIPEEWGIKKEIKKSGIGPHVGMAIELPFKVEYFSFLAGLIYTHKGESRELFNKDTTDQKRSYSKVSLFYLEIPITGKYSFRLGKNINMYALSGLYFGYGVIGKIKYEFDLTGEYYSGENKAWGRSGLDVFKRTDAGAIFGAGLKMGSFGIEYNYNMGLADVIVSTTNGEGATFQVSKLSLTYQIWEFK